MPLPDDIREAAAWVAARARHVTIDRSALEAYADGVPTRGGSSFAAAADPASAAARVLCLDAINFGSGWFPTLRKPPGVSGYGTVAAALGRQFDDRGPWTPEELTALGAAELAGVLGQDPGHELMELYAAALRELGARIGGDFGGRWLGPVEESASSAVALAEIVAAWPGWRDVSRYDDREVPFFKRAQILPADLARAGVADFPDLGRLTMFADNLVPHVLRLDGVLRFAPELLLRIDAGEVLAHGSPEEVEIRACALRAVELMVARRPDLRAYEVDELLWTRGGEPRYKAAPRHRARSTAY